MCTRIRSGHGSCWPWMWCCCSPSRPAFCVVSSSWRKPSTLIASFSSNACPGYPCTCFQNHPLPLEWASSQRNWTCAGNRWQLGEMSCLPFYWGPRCHLQCSILESISTNRLLAFRLCWTLLNQTRPLGTICTFLANLPSLLLSLICSVWCNSSHFVWNFIRATGGQDQWGLSPYGMAFFLVTGFILPILAIIQVRIGLTGRF